MDEREDITGKEKNDALNQFGRLYEKHAPGMLFHARKFVDFQTAEDIVHDVFLKLWTRDSFLIIDQTIGGYLLRSVQNACFDYLKHQSVRDDYLSKATLELKMEELAAPDNPVNELIEQEQIDSIYQMIEQLPPKCKEIFKLTYIEEKENAEVARMLGISVRTVEAQIYKALKIVRNALTAFILWII
ncbi:MAG: RNA polymerase sigma-70 factor [Tannerella sp.]|jgi:RNA polymerase sigma-70 factor (ECF subfamily)|nr:RNA polymerase sigma-70 factor [Tannerella sp.]